MVEGLIRGLLGPSLAPLLDWVLENQFIVAIILAVVLALYIAGRVQLSTIRKETEEMVLELSAGHIKNKPHITSRGLFKKIYPVWSEQVGSWAKFIPHKHDLWPVPIKPETVAAKMGFDHVWIADALKANNVELDEFKVEEGEGEEREAAA
jgi:hypothetical protein